MKLLKATLLSVWLVLFALGVTAVYERITEGLIVTALTSYVSWGLFISTDIYFIGLSAGAFLISSLVYVFRLKALERIGKFALFTALVMLVAAILNAWMDIGQIGRFYEIYTRPNFLSLLNDIVWLYTAYFLLLLGELWLAIRPDLLGISQQKGMMGWLSRLLLLGHTTATTETLMRDRKVLRVLAGAGVPLAVTFHGGMGTLFATLVARPWWYGPIYPIFFLAGALVSGAGLLTVLVTFFWPSRDDSTHKDTVLYLGHIVLWLLLFDVLLEFAELTVPVWYGVGGGWAIEQTVFFGPYWYVFWVFQILLGIITPLLLLVLFSRSPKAVGVAGGLIALDYFAVRLNIVIPGFISPEIPGLQSAYIDPRLIYSYFPSLIEWGVALFTAMLAVGLIYLGYRFPPLTASGDGVGAPGISLLSANSSEEQSIDFGRRGSIRRSALKALGVGAIGAAVAVVRGNYLKGFGSGLLYAKKQEIESARERFITKARQSLNDLVSNGGLASANQVADQTLIDAANNNIDAPSALQLVVPTTATTTPSDQSSVVWSSDDWSKPYTWLPGQPAIQSPSEPISGEQDPIGRMMQDLARALTKPANQHSWVMVIDGRRCTGCYACTVGCKAENKEPPGVVYRPVVLQEHGEYPNLSMTFLPRPCMQCDDPPCVPVCPVFATFKRPDGIVAIDYDVCIGCRYCIAACPYQARTFDWGLFYTAHTPQVEPYEILPSFEYGDTLERPVAGTDSPKFNTRKCHFCIHRLESGMLPACVTTCVGRATYFGDLNDPDSYVSQLITQQGVTRLKTDLGTEPKVYYIDLTEDTVDGRPVEG